MQQTLRISVTLLTNRFHGEGWPSSPARLFRALVAGSMTGGYRERWEEAENALRWLEGLPAPVILATEGRPGRSYRISVPNNDMDVAAKEWQAGRDFDPAKLRTMKEVKPILLAANGPHIAYTWRDVELDEVKLAGLRHAVHSLHTLGWGVDMAYAEVSLGNAGPLTGQREWRPAPSGEQLLPVPTEGSLDDLHETYKRSLGCLSPDGVNPDTRPSVYRLQAYRTGDVRNEMAIFDLRTCSGDGPYSKPAQSAMEIAAWMRHAASQSLLSEGYDPIIVNAVALGHAENEQRGARLSYLGLPSIGHPNADGRIRRVMVTGVAGVSGDLITSIARKLHSSVLIDEGRKATCRLSISESTKSIARYVRSGRSWDSVTPVVLHGYNSLRGQISNHKTERLLLQAFENSGIDANNIERIACQAAPLWPNTGSARSYRVPAHLKNWPRYHVSVVFRTPVAGPVVVGLGRHYGIGTLACSD